MKILIYIFVVIFFVYCNKSGKTNYYGTKELKSDNILVDDSSKYLRNNDEDLNIHCSISKIEVFYVSIVGIFTIISIDCQDFYAYFNDRDSLIITKKSILKQFETEIEYLKKNKILDRRPDTRIQLWVYSKDESEITQTGQDRTDATYNFYDANIVCIDYFTLTESYGLYKLLRQFNIVDKLDDIENNIARANL
jgi:hypothetical protein